MYQFDKVGEWLNPPDCKSGASASKVQILPLSPFLVRTILYYHMKEKSRLCCKCKNPSFKQSMCKSCRIIYIGKHYLSNREEYRETKKRQNEKRKKHIAKIKTDSGCIDCKNKSLPSCCYEFDHIRDKIKNVSKLMTYSIKRIDAEITKCEIVCRNCHKERTYINSNITIVNKSNIVAKKREIVNRIKSQPCTDCNRSYNYWIMEMDHRRGEKSIGINKITCSNHSIEALMRELEKCDVVCSNCHAIRTANDNNRDLIF